MLFGRRPSTKIRGLADPALHMGGARYTIRRGGLRKPRGFGAGENRW